MSAPRACVTRIRTALACIAVLSAASASAQWQENGKPVPDEAWRKSDGPFGAMLMLTDRPDDFMEQWEKPAAPGYQPNLHLASEVRRGDVVAAMVFFHHCQASAQGNCRANLDYKVLRPDGSVYAERRGMRLWDVAPPPDPSLEVAIDQLHIGVEPTDPLGTYQVQTEVYDHVAQRRVSLVRSFTVVDTPAATAK